MKNQNKKLREVIVGVTVYVIESADKYKVKTCAALLANKKFQKSCAKEIGMPFNVLKELLTCGAVNTEIIELGFAANK